MFRKYLMMLDEEIKDTVKCQVEDGELDYDCEKQLHLMLENRKHIKQFMAEKSAHHMRETLDIHETLEMDADESYTE